MDICLKTITWTIQERKENVDDAKNVDEDSRKRSETTVSKQESGCRASFRQDEMEDPCFFLVPGLVNDETPFLF